MPSRLLFGKQYLSFGQQVEPYQRADDVGYAVTEFLWFEGRPFYPAGSLTHAAVASVRLSSSNTEEVDEDNLDLIFQMQDVDGGHIFEVVLRSNEGTRYGGWLWGRDLELSHEVSDGYRLITANTERGQFRFAFCATSGQYRCCGEAPISKADHRRNVGKGAGA